VKSLADVVYFNTNEPREIEHFDQDLLEKALTFPGRDDVYRTIRERNLSWAQSTLNTILSDVDVAIGCTYGPAWKSTLGNGDSYSDASWITMAPAIAGTPIGTIPMGIVSGLPVGIGVVARAMDEVRLLTALYALEKELGLGVLTPTFVKK
jgi:amidase